MVAPALALCTDVHLEMDTLMEIQLDSKSKMELANGDGYTDEDLEGFKPNG